jgi:hypothetical protein
MKMIHPAEPTGIFVCGSSRTRCHYHAGRLKQGDPALAAGAAGRVALHRPSKPRQISLGADAFGHP